MLSVRIYISGRGSLPQMREPGESVGLGTEVMDEERNGCKRSVFPHPIAQRVDLLCFFHNVRGILQQVTAELCSLLVGKS